MFLAVLLSACRIPGTDFVIFESIAEESSVIVVVEPTPTPSPTPVVAIEDAAFQWVPGVDARIDNLFTDPNHAYGTDTNVACGTPNNADGVIIPGDAVYSAEDLRYMEEGDHDYPNDIYVDCKNFIGWQLRILDPEMPKSETAEATATPAAEVENTDPIGEEVLTADGTWRVKLWQDLSYGPELGHSRPGFGTSINEIGIAVGVDLSVIIDGKEVMLGGGCNQIAVMPESYARDAGGNDWGYRSYQFNPEVTQALDELVVLNHEWARAQINDEDCPELSDEELLIHTFVFWQDSEGVDHLQPWQEFRRATGEDNVIMVHPSDGAMIGWHCGEGDSQDNLADNGQCFVEDVNFWGYLGGGVVHPWEGEVPANTVDVTK
ncbi:MAG: hypothetical protein CO156_02320 [Candidatus Pacebacteria bacterium CG_4_9_14_3_um_filter_40_12]|nr:MAG: hypothetical protein COU64_01500 [Candidatus Pacebacteria bacterium CG10_big_fil_rev_8_21_14_0_10_40_26]PIZ78180.1 MAG: hypothetical protein COY01_05350 [Candidatus Pacebacteria bacterium CG_4_10_14_0_2_um_filter_40_20]PJA69152.1 MAG: hypothetical protein CO156_02320 [Candidatus Pacebacteria bacterium CG_4_9_14_3_um_filter_40_12]PJC41715.1 MAG: hypothetical protein CO041_03285 [Candidatus Pacebacteria bacterium CG_4_9_14_0_2_um_filter_40_15]